MNKNENTKNMKNVAMVISSNVLTIAVALFTGFILPIQLGISDYAYYRVYLLYISYAGFFHFGLVNGIYLKYGNLNLEKIPKKIFRAYSWFMIGLQLVVVIALTLAVFAGSFFMDVNKTIAYIFVIVNIPLVNIKWFYSSINQFTKRFVIDSYVTYLQNALNLLTVLIISWMKWYNFIYLLVFITAINLTCMLITIHQNRMLLWGEREHWKNAEIPSLIKGGFFLMLSEFVGIIILGIDSMFVEHLFSQNDFAMYSFAVSIVSVIYTLISAISNLIYPYLVRVSEKKYAEYYTLMSDVLTVVCIFSMLAFYVAEFIVSKFMSIYMPSIAIVSILYGTIIFRTIIMLVCGNYFKVLKLVKEYTKNNVFAIVISFVLNVVAYVIFKDYRYIAVASLMSFIIWYIVTDALFIRQMKISIVGCIPRYLCIIISLTVFYATVKMEPIPAFFLYLVLACVVCFLCFFKQIKKVIKMIAEKRR